MKMNLKQGGYTYEDYLQIPEEPGYRFEILEGILVKEPSPSVHHQRVTSALYCQLKTCFADSDPEGELFFAPLDLTLSTSNVRCNQIYYLSLVPVEKLCDRSELMALVI